MLESVKNLAIELMGKTFVISANNSTHEISALDIGYYFEFNSRKRSFGTCDYVKKRITLSQPLCEANLDKMDTQITDTILHEIAHAFCVHIYGPKDGRGHDWRWRDIALQIGCNGKRCYQTETVNLPTSKYTLSCRNCGTSVPRHQKPKGKPACAKCCKKHNAGKYSAEYILELRVNY